MWHKDETFLYSWQSSVPFEQGVLFENHKGKKTLLVKHWIFEPTLTKPVCVWGAWDWVNRLLKFLNILEKLLFIESNLAWKYGSQMERFISFFEPFAFVTFQMEHSVHKLSVGIFIK